MEKSKVLDSPPVGSTAVFTSIKTRDCTAELYSDQVVSLNEKHAVVRTAVEDSVQVVSCQNLQDQGLRHGSLVMEKSQDEGKN